MEKKPYTPAEVEQVRIAAKDYPKGVRDTILRLIATIDNLKGMLHDR